MTARLVTPKFPCIRVVPQLLLLFYFSFIPSLFQDTNNNCCCFCLFSVCRPRVEFWEKSSSRGITDRTNHTWGHLKKKMGALRLSWVLVFATVHTIECQTVCSSQGPLEWHPKQHVVRMNWTLMRNICGGPSECRGPRRARQSAGPALSFPQICPLLLQSGDKLAISADESLKSYGIRLLNVSEANFESCSVPGEPAGQFLSPHNINESEHVETKWLNPGDHYFIALHDGDPQLCKLGLRLNVSVRVQLCQASPLLRLCSGNGVCQAGPEDSAYTCRCYHRYSGMFCEKSDPCLENPCKNKGVCLSNGTADPNHRTYKCLCPPHFTGNHEAHTAAVCVSAAHVFVIRLFNVTHT